MNNQTFNISVIKGDGIGPEVTNESIKVLNAIATKFNYQFNFTEALMGACAIDETGNPLPNETIEICKKSDAILFGAIGHPKYDNDPNAKVRPEQGLLKLRKSLNLYANIRPVKTYDSLAHLVPFKPGHLNGVDMVVYRELTSGIYFGTKHEATEDTNAASDNCQYTFQEIEQISKLAFEAALTRKNKLTLIDKANVLATSRLWRKVVQLMATNYPQVQVDYMFVDNAAMQIILNPAQFDVILTENMFGDIISDEASVLSGSLGIMPSASIGTSCALFEPIHGSYPQATNLNIANPIASILSTAMLLDYLQLHQASKLVVAAVDYCMQNNFVTQDIDSTSKIGTSDIGNYIKTFITESK